MNENSLREIEGKKIRRQHLNIFIWFEIIFPLGGLIPMLVMNTLWGDTGTKLTSLSQIFTDIICVDLVLIFPLVIASLLNRFLFGKTVCVLSNGGVNYLFNGQRQFAAWEKIETIEYCIRFNLRIRPDTEWCHARLIGKNLDAYINQAPFMFLLKARKYNRKIKYRFDKRGVIEVMMSALIPVVLSVIFGLELIN